MLAIVFLPHGIFLFFFVCCHLHCCTCSCYCWLLHCYIDWPFNHLIWLAWPGPFRYIFAFDTACGAPLLLLILMIRFCSSFHFGFGVAFLNILRFFSFFFVSIGLCISHTMLCYAILWSCSPGQSKSVLYQIQA